MTYTKFFTPALEQDGVMGAVFDLDDFERVCEENPKVRVLGGMKLLREGYESHVVRPEFGRAWLNVTRGCSWLHVQHGYIAAGAGGTNSMPVRKLRVQSEQRCG